MMENKKSRRNKTAKRLIGYIAGTYKARFIFVCISILISASAGVIGSLFLQVLIDDYITPMLSQAKPDFTPLFHVILYMVGIYLVGVLCTYLYNFLMATISQGGLKRIRDDMFSHMEMLPVKYFDTHTHGETMSRYTNDTDTLRQMISQSIPMVFSSVVTMIVVFVSMVYISIHLTLFATAFTGLMVLTIFKIGNKSKKYFGQQQKSLGEVNGYVEEMMEGQKVVKVLCHEKKAKEDFDVLNEKLCYSSTQANKLANILMPTMFNLSTLLYILIAILGGIMGIKNVGGLTLGSIAAFLQLSRSFTMPLGQIAQQSNFIIMAFAGAERIFELMDEKPEEDNGYVTLVNAKIEGERIVEVKERTEIWAWKYPHSDGSVTYTRLLGDVRFIDVNFGYTEEETTLHNISLYAAPGQKVAFVGATGAGKTTITNLINRFYDIQEGKIYYDGIDIKKIRKSDLRRSIAMVLQDTHLFTGTIMENIRYGKLDATDEEVYEAAKLANADSFISMLPNGYNTMITDDGGDLSQGQRQLLSIARAAVANPPVLILDEATSSIDTRTEIMVQQGMDALMKGRTVFVIAHRLSTVQNADVIMLIDSGRIIECGNHEELIKAKGRYYQLYTGAFELE